MSKSSPTHQIFLLIATLLLQWTPLMPGRRFETYIFGLFNENQKPGSIAEKNFGLFRPDFTRFETYIFGLFNENQKPGSIAEKNFGSFRPDFTPVYDVGIMRGGAQPPPKPALPLYYYQQQKGPNHKWCVAKAEASDIALEANIDYACSKGSTDCKPTQPGGPCFEPNNVRAIASFIMNTYYQTNGRSDVSYSFGNTGVVTTIETYMRIHGRYMS